MGDMPKDSVTLQGIGDLQVVGDPQGTSSNVKLQCIGVSYKVQGTMYLQGMFSENVRYELSLIEGINGDI